MNNRHDIYFALLTQAVFSVDPEPALCAAADLGKRFLKDGIFPEDYINIHQSALLRLAQENPDLKFINVAERLMAPLMEVSMAYSLAFRMDLEHKETTRGQQAQASRLESIGTMASGIAHDFNTIMGIINGYAEMLMDLFPVDQDGHEYTVQIVDATMRARDLIARMLAFARQAPVEAVLVDAVDLIKKILKMVSITLPPSIHINFNSDFDAAFVMAAPLQIEQIVMNLCINAADAMDYKGTLDITIRQAPMLTRVDGSSVNRLCIVVDDDGCGMSPEVQQRAFDPFFTTKEPGKGSGLGLSVIYGIVSDLRGEIQIHSEIGMGTSFNIFLPLKGPEHECAALS